MSETATEAAESVASETGDGGGGEDSLAKKLLIPTAAGVGTLAVTLAARKAPELVRDRLMPKLEQKGGEEAAEVGKNAMSRMQGGGGVVGAIAGKATEKLSGGGGSSKKTRRLPIQRWTDVAVPVEEAYEAWTNFEEFPKFMHRVVSVEQVDDEHVQWQEKIWFSKRQWQGEITDRRKNDRIAWKTTQGTSHSGIVSFHRLDKSLTRVLVTIDFEPSGLIEKMGSGLRFAKRAVQADLARFKAYVEMDNVEGLEYEQPGEREGQESDDGSDDDTRAQANGSRNGGESGEDREDASPEERERARQEREERRSQRRG